MIFFVISGYRALLLFDSGCRENEVGVIIVSDDSVDSIFDSV